MSIFAVLKYGSTNFYSLKDLEALPAPLLFKLQKIVFEYSEYPTPVSPQSVRIAYMFKNKEAHVRIREEFNQILKEYEE